MALDVIWPVFSFVIGGLGVIIWWLGRGYIAHLNKALEKLKESDRRIYERLDQDRAACRDIHLRVERELGKISGRLDGYTGGVRE
ncbi:MAG: hypothetical protein FJ135_02180 [Deltaproteobacteria bacterium]|nr:hypothetical protein [Deltaproteobacteria bacterium]